MINYYLAYRMIQRYDNILRVVIRSGDWDYETDMKTCITSRRAENYRQRKYDPST